MGLADLQDATRTRYRPCTTAVWIDSLTDEQRKGLEYALDARFPLTEIHAQALEDGYPLLYNEFRKHIVRAGCSCGPR